MNVVEIIIKAITTGAVKNIKDFNSNLARLQKTAKDVGQSIKQIGATVGIAIAVLYGMARAVQFLGEQAERLGHRGAAKAINNLSEQFKELGDQLLTIKLPNGSTVFDLLEKGANGLIISLRAIGVVLELSSAGLQRMVIDMQRFIGLAAEATGQTTEWTSAWRDQAIAQLEANTATRVGLIWEGKLTESIETQTRALRALGNMNKRVGESLYDLIRKNKDLNAEYSRRKSIENAIRQGDARALAEAMAGGGGRDFSNLRSGSGPRANSGSPSAGPKGQGMVVNVFIGNKKIKDEVRTVINDEVFSPEIGKSGGGSGKKK